MSTTSKLGADMLTDEEIFAIADDNDSGRTTSGRRLFSERNLLLFARALLARQPAAIGKEADEFGIDECIESLIEAKTLAAKFSARNQLDLAIERRIAAPLDKDSSKPAAPSVEQDERGAFEAWARNEFDIDAGTPLFREGKGYMGLAINAAWRAWRGSWQARAASTSANVAQGAEAVALTEADVERQYENGIHIGSGLPRETCPCGFCAKHRLGFNSDAQSQIAEVCEDADGYKHIEAVIEDLDELPKGMKLYAAPPAQPTLTDDARDAARYRRIRLGLSDRHGDVYAMIFAPDGDYPESGEKLDAAIDAALTAAQSASGDTHADKT